MELKIMFIIVCWLFMHCVGLIKFIVSVTRIVHHFNVFR